MYEYEVWGNGKINVLVWYNQTRGFKVSFWEGVKG